MTAESNVEGVTEPLKGSLYHNLDNNHVHRHDGERWVDVTEETTKGKNTFGYRDIYSQGSHVYPWQVMYDGELISGTSNTVRQAYRDAKKAVKRHRKMERFLNR